MRESRFLSGVARHFGESYKPGDMITTQKAGVAGRAGAEAWVVKVDQSRNQLTVRDRKWKEHTFDLRRDGDKISVFQKKQPVDGRQYHRSTGTENKKEAEIAFAKIKTEIFERRWREADEARNRTFEELTEKYLAEHSRVHKASSTQSKDAQIATRLDGFFSGLTLNQITPRLITEYKTQRLTEGAAPATVRNELRLLSHAFNVAIKQWEWLKDNPVSKVSFKDLKARTIDRWLTAEEEERLLKATAGKLYGQLTEIVILALHTGMSQEEMLNLTWPQVDLFRRTLTTTRQKTRHTRTIPINSTVVDLLKQRMKIRSIGGSHVFFNGSGNKIDASKLKKAFIKAVEVAEIQDFRFHDLRHTFATRLVQAGVDLYKVARLL